MPASVKKTARMAGSKFAKTESTSWSRVGARFVCTMPRRRHASSGETSRLEAKPDVRTSATTAAVASLSGRTTSCVTACIASAMPPPIAAESRSCPVGSIQPGAPSSVDAQERATSNSTMQAMLLSATAAIRVFTKTPFARVSFTRAMIVAGAVAIETAAKSRARSGPARVNPHTDTNTSRGRIVASVSSRKNSRRPALRRRRMFRWAPTVTAISPRANWVSGSRPSRDASSNRSRPARPRQTPPRIWPVTPGSPIRRVKAPNDTPTRITTARMSSGPAESKTSRNVISAYRSGSERRLD